MICLWLLSLAQLKAVIHFNSSLLLQSFRAFARKVLWFSACQLGYMYTEESYFNRVFDRTSRSPVLTTPGRPVYRPVPGENCPAGAAENGLITAPRSLST